MNDFYVLIDTCPEPSMGKKHEFSEEELKKLIQTIVIEMKIIVLRSKISNLISILRLFRYEHTRNKNFEALINILYFK